MSEKVSLTAEQFAPIVRETLAELARSMNETGGPPRVIAGEMLKLGAEWIIEEGLKPGEKVVAEGTQRVKAGTTVDPKPFKAMPETKQPEPTAKSETR